MNELRVDRFHECERTLELFSERIVPYSSQETKGCSRRIVRVLLRTGLIEPSGKWHGRRTYRITMAGFKIRDEAHMTFLTRRHKRRFHKTDHGSHH